jgi:hypothetical protein
MEIVFFSIATSPQVKLNDLRPINNISSKHLSNDVMTKNQVRKMIYLIERFLVVNREQSVDNASKTIQKVQEL